MHTAVSKLGVLAQGPRHGPEDLCTCAYGTDRAISSDCKQLGAHTDAPIRNALCIAIQQ